MKRAMFGRPLRRSANLMLAIGILLSAGSESRKLNAQSPVTARTTLRLPVPDLNHEGPNDPLPSRLLPLVQRAVDEYRFVRENVRDYTCVMVRRERVEGRLGPHEFIQAKVRHRQVQGGEVVVPFSVYLRFLRPASVADREVLYVEGQNDGNLLARRGGKRFAFVTAAVDPLSEVAMQGNRYPVTEFGIENLLARLIETAQDKANRNVQVQFLEDARINDRPAFGVIVTQPKQTDEATFFQARVFSDREFKVPVHYEAYAWPREPGGDPLLLEQYTYTQLQFNVGLTDFDFDADNPAYQLK